MYYQIQGSNVRLLGSLHMVPVGEAPVPTWAKQAYEWCEALFVEHVPETFWPYFKSTESLKDQLPADLYSSLHHLWPLQGPLAPLHQLKPWAALIGLAALSQSSIEGVEPNFLRWAQDKKTVRCLEDPSDVSLAFEAVPGLDIQTALNATLQDREKFQSQLVEMHSAWVAHDAEKLLSLVKETPMFTLPALRSAVLKDRNKNWLPKVDALLGTKQRILVVVGALHLCGPDSLLELLAEKGHHVMSIG